MSIEYVVFLAFIVAICETAKPTIEGTTATAYPCNEHKLFAISLELNESPQDQEYKYFLYLHYNKLDSKSTIRLKFTHGVNITVFSNNYAGINYGNNRTEVTLSLNKDKIGGSRIDVTSLNFTQIPYITSILFNAKERCKEPNLGVFNNLLHGPQGLALSLNQPSGPICGRRQLIHTELITNSIQSKPGDWPWHVAIYRQEIRTFDYKCGGTLLSNNVVLTAAHCVMKRGIKKRFPANKLKAYFGKYNLYEVDSNALERQIERVKVHENYDITTVNNDIALVQLKTEVEFDEYIQPACLWDPEMFDAHLSQFYGTIVGWGYDTSDHLSHQLRQATIPIIDGFTCVLSNHIFFGKYLNEYKFCAGYKNGTSACNGDSGGGFVIFLPDRPNNTNYLEGSWYVKGIVSIGVSRREINICQPNEYVLFTDVAKYKHWIEEHMSFNHTEDIEDEPETGIPNQIQVEPSVPATGESICGQRLVLFAELVLYGQTTKPGDYPWHTAVFSHEKNSIKYRCGGTLISKNVVLSGGPCVSHYPDKLFDPENLIVKLGQYNLLIEDIYSQTKQVAEVVVHERFTHTNLENDISLLRLKSNVVYTDYVQPICLWNSDVSNKFDRKSTILGMVPGWGLDETGVQTQTLHQAQMPIVSDGVCARNSDIFRNHSLNKFCAGFLNGTSVCNGDSGATMAVYVPNDKVNSKGAWYARGIVSVASVNKNHNSSIRCDSTQYVFFTDLELYSSWIESKMIKWIFV